MPDFNDFCLIGVLILRKRYEIVHSVELSLPVLYDHVDVLLYAVVNHGQLPVYVETSVPVPVSRQQL